MTEQILSYRGPSWTVTTSPLGRAVWYWQAPGWVVTAYRETPTGSLSIVRIPQPAAPPGKEGR
jgi:hypothetical protein